MIKGFREYWNSSQRSSIIAPSLLKTHERGNWNNKGYNWVNLLYKQAMLYGYSGQNHLKPHQYCIVKRKGSANQWLCAMVNEINTHGLSRDIPKDVKRQVRQECGFGCVICGLAIATYEHIDPPFKDAREHDPSKIAYLCGGCHDRVTRGVWSKQKVMQARLDPWCIRHHRCHDSFDISVPQPVIWLGPNEIININKILRIDDHVILAIDPPEQPGAPYSISGEFYDD